MAIVTLKGNEIETFGPLPEVGTKSPDFTLVKQNLSEVTLQDFAGKRIILNIFPSLDTGTCAASVRTFNQKAASLYNTEVLCVSGDLPFAASRFCVAEDIKGVETASSFRNSEFGTDYGVQFQTGPLKGLLARSIVVVDTQGKVIYNELVSETINEPNYEAAIAVL
jgi:thioredoxin-dependent peroxiredoxin